MKIPSIVEEVSDLSQGGLDSTPTQPLLSSRDTMLVPIILSTYLTELYGEWKQVARVPRKKGSIQKP